MLSKLAVHGGDLIPLSWVRLAEKKRVGERCINKNVGQKWALAPTSEPVVQRCQRFWGGGGSKIIWLSDKPPLVQFFPCYSRAYCSLSELNQPYFSVKIMHSHSLLFCTNYVLSSLLSLLLVSSSHKSPRHTLPWLRSAFQKNHPAGSTYIIVSTLYSILYTLFNTEPHSTESQSGLHSAQ